MGFNSGFKGLIFPLPKHFCGKVHCPDERWFFSFANRVEAENFSGHPRTNTLCDKPGSFKDTTYFCQKWDIKLLVGESHHRVNYGLPAFMNGRHQVIQHYSAFHGSHEWSVKHDLPTNTLWHYITFRRGNTQLTGVTAHYSTVIYSAGNGFSTRFIIFFPLSFPCTPSYRVTPWFTVLNNQHTGVQKLTETHFRQPRISSPKWLRLQYVSVNLFTDESKLNPLSPSGHYMYHQFNIHKLYVLSTLYLCVLCGSQNKQRLFPYTALTDWFL